jgi:spermidine/putrescine transport system ATP-binding protein
MTSPTPALRLEGLHRRFGDYVAVKSLDLEIGDGEFFSLIGPSGCGKTTTLRMIAGLEQPTSGLIEVGGKDVTHTQPYRRPVNTVFQNYALFPHLDIFENVAFGLRERKVATADIRPRVEKLLELVGLADRQKHKPRMLSGGQQQRVALARALVLEPDVLLLDEPLGALDLKLRKSMQALLREVQREVGITFVYVTHDQEEAFSMSTRVGVMNGGVLEQVGTPRDVYRHPQTVFVADFVGASNHLPVTVSRVAGPGEYLVTVAGQAVTCCGPEGLDAGSSAVLVVRPEGVTVTAEASESFCVPGRVVDASYSGPHEELCLRTEIGDIRATLRGDIDLFIDDSATVSWAPSASWLVPASPVGGSTSTDDGAVVDGLDQRGTEDLAHSQ